jgi:cell division septation protein DedD
MFPLPAGTTRLGAAKRTRARRDSGSFASSLLTFFMLLLVMALGFVFGRVVIARAYVRGSAELKKTGSPAAAPGGQALSSSALAGSAGAAGEEQPAARGQGGESETSSNGALPREEIGPDPETTQGQPTEGGPEEQEDLPPVEDLRYAVQVGAFGNEESARAAATRLTRTGYPARIEVDRHTRTYRVVTGSYESEAGAQAALGELQGEGFPEAFVVAR